MKNIKECLRQKDAFILLRDYGQLYDYEAVKHQPNVEVYYKKAQELSRLTYNYNHAKWCEMINSAYQNKLEYYLVWSAMLTAIAVFKKDDFLINQTINDIISNNLFGLKSLEPMLDRYRRSQQKNLRSLDEQVADKLIQQDLINPIIIQLVKKEVLIKLEASVSVETPVLYPPELYTIAKIILNCVTFDSALEHYTIESNPASSIKSITKLAELVGNPGEILLLNSSSDEKEFFHQLLFNSYQWISNNKPIISMMHKAINIYTCLENIISYCEMFDNDIGSLNIKFCKRMKVALLNACHNTISYESAFEKMNALFDYNSRADNNIDNHEIYIWSDDFNYRQAINLPLSDMVTLLRKNLK